ncbi:BRCT domain-containing protein [Quillaja saponaria]|uniref:RING-type E3 ubiquitin transferase BRCA1 n=1 Tax=Quillaja saponaria TaxID=32244 RepID=A0AAD7P528_QUISA|nr:BRCT domain-containing protein [Quillaja saponaria]
MENDRLQHQLTSRCCKSDVYPIQGMESVIITVSGYHGSERFNLIKLISHSGANYVGAMSGSITHLVCWKFEGKKFNLAKKFKTVIVNHRWVEDCINQGKRVPEHSYTLQSGQEVGPLLLEAPLIVKECASSKNKVLCGNPDGVDSDKQKTEFSFGASGNPGWTDSCLVEKNLCPDYGKCAKLPHKSERKLVKKSLKQENLTSSRYTFQMTPLSRLVRTEEESSSHSSQLMSEKRKISNSNGAATSAEPSRKAKRLVKKNVAMVLEPLIIDLDHDYHINGVHSPHCDIAAPNPSGGVRNITEIREGFDDELYDERRNSAGVYDDIEEIEDWNILSASNNSTLCIEDSPTATGKTLKGTSSSAENLNEIEDLDEFDHVTKLSTSPNLSCVICWTAYSSTRGILPCKHRFCYSCIQKWALKEKKGMLPFVQKTF